MKNTVIPVICSLAMAGMAAAALSHWWSVLECAMACTDTSGGGPITLSLPAAPVPMLASTPTAEPAAPSPAPMLAATALPLAAATPDRTHAAAPAAAQREFYEAMLDEMRQIKKENLDLRDQVAETNRDLMKLEFRVDTHSESFRPLPGTPAEPEVLLPVLDEGDGLLPPLPSVLSLSR